MSVVDNNLRKQTVAVPQSLPTSTLTDEQIAELNELLVHVLDELSAMKEALHANAKKAEKQINKLKAPNKRQQQESDVTAEDEEEPSDESEEEAVRETVPPSRKPQAHQHPARTKRHDFTSCF
jgi:hypothetical protein